MPRTRAWTARDLKTLAEFVPLDEQPPGAPAPGHPNAPRKSPVQIMEDMSWEEFSAINVRAPELPGVTADMGEVRVYPFAAPSPT